jgi:hypothetical protein
MINIHARQAFEVSHPKFGAFRVPLGRSSLPEPATDCEQFQFYVDHDLVTLDSHLLAHGDHVENRIAQN